MNLNDYLSPLSINGELYTSEKFSECLMHNIQRHSEKNPIKNVNKFDIAIFGVQEDRNTNNNGCNEAPDDIRKELYKLYKPFSNIKIYDLGNLKKGFSVNDTYVAVTEVVTELIKQGVITIIIGGSQDISYAVFMAYQNLKKTINIATIDSRFDLSDSENEFNSNSFLSKILSVEKNKLFSYSNIGYQTYYVSTKERELMDELYFDTLRVGMARNELSDTEPYIRDADFVSLDINSVKQADAPGHINPSINGFYGEEICQLAGYSGISDNLTSFGLFEVNPKYDEGNRTIKLSAQILWHFIQGYYLRKNEFPENNSKNYKKMIVSVEGTDDELIFYKSFKTGRLWMEIPYLYEDKEKTTLISCSYSDYNKAINNEIPDRWWKYFQKLN